MKNLAKKLVVFLMALTVVAACLPTNSVKAAEGITVTFRAGNVGSFNADSTLYQDGTEVTANYVKVTLPRQQGLTLADFIDAGFTYGLASSNIDTVLETVVTPDEGYALLSATECGIKATDSITHNTEYVMDYGVLVNPVKYTIRFVDASSYNTETKSYDREVATPIMGYGSDGDTVTRTTPIVNQYGTNIETYSLTLSADAENTLSVEYAYTGVDYAGTVTYEDVYQYLTQDQIITINVPGGAGGAGGAANAGNGGAAAADGNADGGDANANIADNNTPLGANDNTTDDSNGTTTIEDSATPESAGTVSEAFLRNAMIGAGAAVVLAAALVIFLTQKNKKKAKANVTEEEHKEEK